MSHHQGKLPHILFLFSDTGGGHRSAAEAIIEAFELEFPAQATMEMVDIFKQYAPRPLNLAPVVYPTLSKMPTVWKIGYHISDGKYRTRFAYSMMWPYLRSSLRRLFREHPADLVVSVHQLINTPVSRAVKKTGVPFMTVVTDLVSTHAAWFCPAANRIIVPTDAAYLRGLSMGIQPDQMEIAGLPVANRFCQPKGDPRELRARLGWPQDIPLILLVGGGEGMGPLAETAYAIDAARLPAGLVVIAGRNKGLKEKLEAHPWKIPAKIYGFVTEMPDFMRAADVLVTKAGPGTISEAFIAGLPLILYSKMPGQEDGNVDYVVNKKAGVWAPEPAFVVKTLRNWLDHPQLLSDTAEISHQLARPDAARQIARALARQVKVTL